MVAHADVGRYPSLTHSHSPKVRDATVGRIGWNQTWLAHEPRDNATTTCVIPNNDNLVFATTAWWRTTCRGGHGLAGGFSRALQPWPEPLPSTIGCTLPRPAPHHLQIALFWTRSTWATFFFAWCRIDTREQESCYFKRLFLSTVACSGPPCCTERSTWMTSTPTDIHACAAHHVYEQTGLPPGHVQTRKGSR